MNLKKKINCKVTASGEIAYVTLPTNADVRKVAKNVRLHTLLEGYVGPDVIFDFDQSCQLIGIEIMLE